ncbi:hypothetical protein SELMODRAFT_155184 [Selaginella moellendorffii]|uniref:Serine aminopeptidase S33 domain-containing protein n=1 Tax=Selaginella moellendorffii TaxID=88036 RepID=D8SGQ4_SELML|nr:caffeoylshikimate esterase [Selaginella moellendorffii]EFJ16244.1 hypothetical protein SELMODRAFT_155184 [Selaginella moellendorffii]|eukprot:XP_002982491.1 caffeoylshikimate esterase [Selaginella moellendorffii]
MAPATSLEKPAYYWGDEISPDDFYAQQGVRHAESHYTTPHGTLFTQSFLPLDAAAAPRALIFLTHGYGSDSGWLFQSIAITLAQWGFAAYCADLLGHGRSDGLHGYVWDVDAFADANLRYFHSVRDKPEFSGLKKFLFGESMGGGLTLLMCLKDPKGWDGVIVTAPLIVIPELMQPSKLHLFGYGLLLGLAESWAVMPENNIVRKAIKDPARGKLIASNPRRYKGKPRVGTMRNLARMCEYLQKNVEKIEMPLLALHGTSDVVAETEGSRILYDKAKSQDKTIKIYEDYYHSLLQGEPEEARAVVYGDIKQWLDDHC